MNNDRIFQVIKVILLAIITIGVGMMSVSVYSVIGALTGDDVRAFVVTAVMILALVLWLLWLREAVSRQNKNMIAAATGITVLYGALFLVFVLTDRVTSHQDLIGRVDDRLQFFLQNTIWIPATITGLAAFWLHLYGKHSFGSKYHLPIKIVVFEVAVAVFAIWGSAWGTADAYELLTSNRLSGYGMALLVDAMILISAMWHLKANDPETNNMTYWMTVGYTILALGFQLIDGVLRVSSFETNTEIIFYAQFALPSVIVVSVALGIALYFVDSYHGGLSFGKQEKNPEGGKTEGGKPEFRKDEIHRPRGDFRHNRPPMSNRPNTRTEQNAQGGQMPKPQYRPEQTHGGKQFAEPGGLPEELVARLREMGWSGNRIRKMNLAEAKRAVNGEIKPPPNLNVTGQPQVKNPVTDRSGDNGQNPQ